MPEERKSLPKGTTNTGSVSRTLMRKATTSVGGMISGLITRVSTKTNPLERFVRLENEKIAIRSESVNTRIDNTIKLSYDLAVEQNQLLSQIVKEIKDMDTDDDSLPDLDLDRVRKGGGQRGRYGAAGRARLDRKNAARRTAAAERFGKRAAEVVKGVRSTLSTARAKAANAISPPRSSETIARPPVTLETRPEVRPPVTPETRPPATPETRPETRPPVTPETRPEARPSVTSGSRPAVTQGVQGVGRQAASSAALSAVVGQATGQDPLQSGIQAAQSAAATVIISQSAEQIIKEVASRFISRTVLSKVPLAGLLASLWFAKERVDNGDWVGAGLEISSGTAGTLGAVTFGLGTATSIAIDTAQLTRDVYKALYGKFPEEETDEQIRNNNLAAIGPAITRALNQLISSAPRPTTPPFNDETRDRLRDIYRLASESEEANNIIGEDTRVGIGQLLRLNINGTGRQAEKARESMANVVSRLQPLVTPRISSNRATISQTNTAATPRTSEREPVARSTTGEAAPTGATRDQSQPTAPVRPRGDSSSLVNPSTNALASMGIGGSSPAGSSTSPSATAVGIPSATGAQSQQTGDFMSEVNRVSEKFGLNPADMLALMRSESSLNPQAVNASTGATGLIQFMPATARSLGTTTEALRGMSAAQQMQYVEKYFDSVRLPQGASAGQLYAYVFLPGRARREVLTAAGENFYEANRGLDMDGDGRITISDLDMRMARYGGTLASSSASMAAADQAQLMRTGQGSSPTVATTTNPSAGGRSSTSIPRTGEVPLNRRLQKQVA